MAAAAIMSGGKVFRNKMVAPCQKLQDFGTSPSTLRPGEGRSRYLYHVQSLSIHCYQQYAIADNLIYNDLTFITGDDNVSMTTSSLMKMRGSIN